jgi:hypothetical protein
VKKPAKIERLEQVARDMVGDGGKPNLFFVTDQGIVVAITRDFDSAFLQWKDLADRRPRAECAIEDRKTGVLAAVEPENDEPGAKLIMYNDTSMLRHK